MQLLSNRSESNCRSIGNCQDKRINTIVGWNSEAETEIDLEDYDLACRLISSANKYIKLSDIFREYGIKFINSGANWEYKTTCPLPMHKGGRERTPSFFYSPRNNLFKCFGCNAGGKAVQFIAYFTSRQQIDVAREILENYDALDDSCIDELYNSDEVIFEFSDFVRKFIKSHKDSEQALTYAENILRIFDIYLSSAVRNILKPEELEARIALHKNKLEHFGE